MNKEITSPEYNIYTIRSHRVMLDEDLAKIYGVETKVLNQAIRRNKERFPEDFMFKLTDEEYQNLKSQIVTSSWGGNAEKPIIKPNILRSQIVTSNRGGRKYKPFVFTEHGTVMLASVLRSKRAIQMNIEVIKAFVQLRHAISSQTDMLKQLSEVRNFILKQSNKTDREFRKVWNAIESLTNPIDDEPNGSIGFKS